ncbi:exodeoxyribonuclease VII small subunit [Calditerrivibrio sp.]|uniref:exodeoxyribonuclease VII small subunit n=1 Tax=Calditerrivibrio sp. TaxID=2792612 RepID=UPI003D0BA100
MKFEDKLKRLEEIIAILESEEYGIEDTLGLFQEGMNLVKECKKTLSEIELKVEKILSAEDGEIKKEPFDEA